MRISDWSSDVCSSDLLGLHDLLPAPVGCLHAGGQQAVVRALDGDDVLVARHAARLLEVLAFAIERQHLAAVIQVAFVDPHVDHPGADPGADVALPARVVAERPQRGRGAAAPPLPLTFGAYPKSVQPAPPPHPGAVDT